MTAHVGVVAGEHEEGVLEPGLLGSRLEEAADGLVGITDALVDFKALVRELLAVLLGHDERMVTGGGEDGRHEGLLHA